MNVTAFNVYATDYLGIDLPSEGVYQLTELNGAAESRLKLIIANTHTEGFGTILAITSLGSDLPFVSINNLSGNQTGTQLSGSSTSTNGTYAEVDLAYASNTETVTGYVITGAQFTKRTFKAEKVDEIVPPSRNATCTHEQLEGAYNVQFGDNLEGTLQILVRNETIITNLTFYKGTDSETTINLTGSYSDKTSRATLVHSRGNGNLIWRLGVTQHQNQRCHFEGTGISSINGSDYQIRVSPL